jgi:acyloxyacyl hydrolase
MANFVPHSNTPFTPKALSSKVGTNPCGLNATCNLKRFTDQHFPIEDADGDGFDDSENGTLRGWHWRGRDCYPTSDDRYPGRKTAPSDPSIDHNCNGIKGANSSGSFESQFCSGANEQRGLILLGDSATAHFHIPPQWMTANGWSEKEVLSSASLNR